MREDNRLALAGLAPSAIALSKLQGKVQEYQQQAAQLAREKNNLVTKANKLQEVRVMKQTRKALSY